MYTGLLTHSRYAIFYLHNSPLKVLGGVPDLVGREEGGGGGGAGWGCRFSCSGAGSLPSRDSTSSDLETRTDQDQTGRVGTYILFLFRERVNSVP